MRSAATAMTPDQSRIHAEVGMRSPLRLPGAQRGISTPRTVGIHAWVDLTDGVDQFVPSHQLPGRPPHQGHHEETHDPLFRAQPVLGNAEVLP